MTILVCSRCSGQVIALDSHIPEGCPKCGATLDMSAEVTNALDQTGVAAATPEPPPLRAKIGRYDIVSLLGSGGCSTVYLARDGKLARLVAIKVPDAVTRHDPAAAERFAREGRTAAQLRHPGIVSIFNVEEDEGLVFIVSEYIEGEPLSSQLKKNRSSFRAVASLLAAVASAVEYAHSKGIIHRDIKPGNIMIDVAGNPRLMDFGLAKQVERDAIVTMQEHVLGTPAYMSPEQARGNSHAVDRRTDVYSLGATLYHLLTQQIPFYGEAGIVRDKVLHEQPIRPRMVDRRIPIDLETICLKAMEKNPAQRYQTAGDLADDLERWLRGEPIVARHIGSLERSWRWCRRNPAPAGMIVSVALLLLVASIGSMVIASLAAKGRKQEAEGRRQAEIAKKVEADARQAAVAALEKSRESLSREYLERGNRYVRASESSDDYNPIKALPWFLQAMKVDADNPHRLLADRIRLQTELDFTPKIERMWFAKRDVRDARMVPEGDKFFVLTEKDRTLRIWRTAAENLPFVSLSIPSQIDAAAFSRDGRLIATGSQDGVRIWEADSGKPIKGPLISREPLPGSRALPSGLNIRSLIFSKSGRLLSILSLEGVNQIWNASTGKLLGKPSQSNERLVDFADSERALLLLSRDRKLHAYDVQTGSEKYVLGEKGDGYAAATVSQDGTLIAGRGTSDKLVIFAAATGKMVKQLAAPVSRGYVTATAFSPDGKLLAAGSVDGVVRIWNVDDGQLLWTPRQVLPGFVGQLEFSADGASLAATNFDKRVQVVAVQSGSSVAPPIGTSGRMLFARWSDVPGRILTVDIDGIARMWNVEGSAAAQKLPCQSEISIGTVSADRRVLAAAEAAGTVHLLKLSSDLRFDVRNRKRVEVGDRAIDAIALTNDGSRLAVSSEGQVTIWDTSSQKQIAGPLLHSGARKRIRFTPNGTLLVAVSDDGRFAVWNVTSGRQLYERRLVGERPMDFDIDREGKRCAVAGLRGVTIWELASGQQVCRGLDVHNTSNFVRFLADGRKALISPLGKPRLADLEKVPLQRSLGLYSNVQCVALSEDKRVVLLGYRDGTARLWKCDGTLAAPSAFEHPSSVQSAFLDPSGRWVVTLTEGSRLFLWDARTTEFVAKVSIPSLWSALSEHARFLHPRVCVVSFSLDNRSIYLITAGGLLVRLELDFDHRTSGELDDEIALRAGEVPDGSSSLKILDSDELARLWHSMAGKLTGLPSTSSRFEPLDFGQEAKAALSTAQVPVQ